jgi:hypothetical protein
MTLQPDLRIEPVRFSADGIDLIGNLFMPGDSAPATPLPAVVVTGT